jgi:hypothetical protein
MQDDSDIAKIRKMPEESGPKLSQGIFLSLQEVTAQELPL